MKDNKLVIPVFWAEKQMEAEAFSAWCHQELEALQTCALGRSFRVGAVQLEDDDQTNAFVAAQEHRCESSFGQTVVRLNREQSRRGWFVKLFPEMQAEGLPCQILCVDLTGGDAPLPEDVPELAAVLEFFGRFCEEQVVVWILTRWEQGGHLAAMLGQALAD